MNKRGKQRPRKEKPDWGKGSQTEIKKSRENAQNTTKTEERKKGW